jgi:hypothetical protein
MTSSDARRVLALCVAFLTPVAGGDYVGLEVEADALALDGVTPLASLGIPNDIAVINVFAVFSEPSDQLIFVGGTFDTNPLLVETGAPGGFFNVGPGMAGGDRPPATTAVSVFPSLNWDSFYTIGNRLLDVGPPWMNGAAFVDVVESTAGLPPMNTNPWTTPDGGWLVTPMLTPPGGGSPERPPQSVAGNWPDNRILILRLAVDTECGISEVSALMTLWSRDAAGTVETHAGQMFVGFVEPPLSVCPADINCDGVVNVLDLTALLSAWGPCGKFCPEDVNDDGTVDVLDLLELLEAWGPCV